MSMVTIYSNISHLLQTIAPTLFERLYSIVLPLIDKKKLLGTKMA